MINEEGVDLEKAVKAYNDFLNSGISRIKFIPRFVEEDMAFERMLFSGIGLYLRIVAHNTMYTDDVESLIVGEIYEDSIEKPFSFKPYAEFEVVTPVDMLITIFDILYNFYYDIDGHYVGNKEATMFVCINVMGSTKDSVLFEIPHLDVESNTARNKRKMIEDFSKYCTDNHGSVNAWDNLKEDIKNTLYIDDNFCDEMANDFSRITNKCEFVIRDIFRKYDLGHKRVVRCYETADNDQLFSFPTITNINGYIDSFYNIAKLCISNFELFSQSDEAQKIVDRILNFGIMNTDRDENGQLIPQSRGFENFWILSPFALNSLRNVYERTVNFADNMMYEYNNFNGYLPEEKENLISVLEHNFISSCIEDFKRWIYINGKNSLVTLEGESNTLRHYMCKRLSSISMIRAVRLYEKIKSFLQAKPNTKSLSICAIGYTRIARDKSGKYERCTATEVDELCTLLKCTFPNVDIKYTAVMNIKSFNKSYLKRNYNVLEEKNAEIKSFVGGRQLRLKKSNNKVKVIYTDYDKLFSRKSVDEMIDRYDMLFLLDCPELYYEEFYPHFEGTWQGLYDMFNNTSYKKNYEYARLGSRIDSKGVLSEIDKQLSVLSNKYPQGRGSFNPAIKEYLFDYIYQKVKEEKKDVKTVYCYLSTLESATSSKYKHMSVVHKEYYNNKCFNILKLSCEKEEKLSSINIKSSDLKDITSICFSAWNLIKNVGLRLKTTLFNSFDNDKIFTPYLLDRIGIEFSWDTSMKNFKVRWGIDPAITKEYKDMELFKHQNSDTMNRLLLDLFNLLVGRTDLMIGKSVRDAICNILLGRASNAVHLLLYYRIKMMDLYADGVSCEQVIDASEIKQILYRNIITSIPEKKTYIDFMSSYGTFSLDSIQKSTVKIRVTENGSDYNQVFKNIYDACRLCKYTDSNIFYNMGV